MYWMILFQMLAFGNYTSESYILLQIMSNTIKKLCDIGGLGVAVHTVTPMFSSSL